MNEHITDLSHLSDDELGRLLDPFFEPSVNYEDITPEMQVVAEEFWLCFELEKVIPQVNGMFDRERQEFDRYAVGYLRAVEPVVGDYLGKNFENRGTLMATFRQRHAELRNGLSEEFARQYLPLLGQVEAFCVTRLVGDEMYARYSGQKAS